MDGLMKRILTISRVVALGANIGLEHLVFIEGRLSFSVFDSCKLLASSARVAQTGLEQPQCLPAGSLG